MEFRDVFSVRDTFVCDNILSTKPMERGDSRIQLYLSFLEHKNSTPIYLLLNYLKRPRVHEFNVCRAYSNFISTKQSNLQCAHHFMDLI